MPNLLSSAQAAERLNVDQSTINRWVRTGRLTPAIQFPGRTGARLFDLADVDQLDDRPKQATS
jgi:excisionase family DNA binding protein